MNQGAIDSESNVSTGNEAQDQVDSVRFDASKMATHLGLDSKLFMAVLQTASVYGIAIGYCLSASLLSIVNKWAIMEFPYPGSLTALQYLTSTLGVWLLGRLHFLEHDPLRMETMWKFLPAALCFYLSLFTNSELLLHANVDTFIVFRSAVPILVAVGETLFLHQPWPLPRTWLSLGVILAGAVVYVFTDSQFTLNAYSWAVAYLVSMTVDFVYIKHIVMTIGLNTWGLVLYNNLEALLLYPLELLLTGEAWQMARQAGKEDSTGDFTSLRVWLPVILSCVLGMSISFFGFACRRSISATSFTVLGVVNKLLTVVINLVIWTRHASAIGTVGLLTCMAGGFAYQQSLSKPPPPPPPSPPPPHVLLDETDEENEDGAEDEEKRLLVKEKQTQ